MRSRTASGMSRGPNRPMRPSKVIAGKPASATVGVSFWVGARWLLVIAISLTRPVWMCGCTIASAPT